MIDTTRDPLLDLVLRAFAVFDGFGPLDREELWWRTDGEYAPLTLGVICNDLFHWATSDVEDLTTENIGMLESALADLEAIGRDKRGLAGQLFCCRARGMRPQRPFYAQIDSRLWPLFDACGPVRSD